MKKVISILGLSAALLVGTASAYTPIQVDDSSFNYEKSEDGYTSLMYNNGKLTLLVSDDASEGSLKITGAAALPIDDASDYSESQLEALLPVSKEMTGVSVEHNNTRLASIVQSYDAMFAAEGFNSNLEQNFANGEVVIYENQGTTARVVFTQSGDSVMVYLTLL